MSANRRGWGSEDLDSETDWQSQTPAVRQLELLQSGALYWNGTETRNGERTMVITGEPTSDALTAYSDDRQQSVFGGPSIDDAALRVWLDADTGRLLRTEFQFTVEDGDTTARTEMTTVFSEYDSPVSITLPDAADPPEYKLGCPGE